MSSVSLSLSFFFFLQILLCRITWRVLILILFNPIGSVVVQSCLTLCDPRDCSMPGFPFLHHLLEFAETHVHWVGDAINHPILCCPLLLLASIVPSSGSFPMSWLFTSGGQSIGVSASASVLPMNIQGLFHLGLTGWSPGCPRDSQESSPTPQLKSINPLALCLLFPGRLQSISSSHQIDCNLPGSSVHGILQATILEWVATTSSRGSSQLRDWTQISYASCTGRQVLYH